MTIYSVGLFVIAIGFILVAMSFIGKKYDEAVVELEEVLEEYLMEKDDA